MYYGYNRGQANYRPFYRMRPEMTGVQVFVKSLRSDFAEGKIKMQMADTFVYVHLSVSH